MRNMRQKVRFIDFFKPFARKNASFAHPSYNNKKGGRSLCCRPYVRVLPPVRARFAALARRFAERTRSRYACPEKAKKKTDSLYARRSSPTARRRVGLCAARRR